MVTIFRMARLSPNDLIVRKHYAYFHGKKFPVAVGRGGIGTKQREGDGITPAGEWGIEEWLFRPDRINVAGNQIRVNDYWSDDPRDPFYNTRIGKKSKFSCENLRRADHLYDLIGVINYNRNPAKLGKGSAIFMHSWRSPRHPTEGCIALSSKNLRWIQKRWHNEFRIIVQP